MKKRNRYYSAFLAAIISVGWPGAANNALGLELIVEEFDGYGPNPVSIHGKNGGTGWTSPWVGRADLKSYSPVNLPGPKNSRFVNRGGSNGESGSMTVKSSEQASFTRSFGEQPITTPIWLSFLAHSVSVDSVFDSNLIHFKGKNGKAFFVGHRQGKIGIYGSDGQALAEANLAFSQGGRASLIISRIDPKVGAIRVWLDPTDLSASDNLEVGDNFAEAKIDLGGAVEPRLSIFLRENRAEKVMLDALRLAFGDEEEDSFEAIVTGARP